LFVLSRDTIFIIGGIGDSEWTMLKNTVNASLHLLTESRKTETLSQIFDQYRQNSLG
jgi:hypothetical protein